MIQWVTGYQFVRRHRRKEIIRTHKLVEQKQAPSGDTRTRARIPKVLLRNTLLFHSAPCPPHTSGVLQFVGIILPFRVMINTMLG